MRELIKFAVYNLRKLPLMILEYYKGWITTCYPTFEFKYNSNAQIYFTSTDVTAPRSNAIARLSYQVLVNTILLSFIKYALCQGTSKV